MPSLRKKCCCMRLAGAQASSIWIDSTATKTTAWLRTVLVWLPLGLPPAHRSFYVGKQLPRGIEMLPPATLSSE